MNTLEILMTARDVLSHPDNWCKKAFTDGEGRFCMIGAIDAASTKYKMINHSIAVAHCRKHIPAIKKFKEMDLLYFNDHPDTTHDMVLEVFDKAIQELQG